MIDQIFIDTFNQLIGKMKNQHSDQEELRITQAMRAVLDSHERYIKIKGIAQSGKTCTALLDFVNFVATRQSRRNVISYRDAVSKGVSLRPAAIDGRFVCLNARSMEATQHKIWKHFYNEIVPIESKHLSYAVLDVAVLTLSYYESNDTRYRGNLDWICCEEAEIADKRYIRDILTASRDNFQRLIVTERIDPQEMKPREFLLEPDAPEPPDWRPPVMMPEDYYMR